MKKVRILAGALLALSFSGAGAALAHEKAHSSSLPAISSEEKEFGRQGSPKEAQRVIQVDMGDTMRFNPSSLTVKKGETIRFEVKNSGKLMHEMVLGTMAELKAHAEMMRKHPRMERDEPYMAHVAPGKTENIVWRFTKPGEFFFGCLVAGHLEAGMIGKITAR